MIPRLTWIAFLLLGFGHMSFAQDADDFFAQKCKACHSIGGGRRVGPDLKDVTSQKNREWMEKFIQNPKAVIDSGDSFAVQLQQEYRGMVMPTVPGITPQLAKSLIDYIQNQSRENESEKTPPQKLAPPEPGRTESAETKAIGEPSGKENESGARDRRHRENESAGNSTQVADLNSPEPTRVPAPTETAVNAGDRPFTNDEVEQGTGLFTGARKLSEGSPACISCHTLGALGGFGGGRLGPNLTGLYDRFGGRDGLGTWLSAAPSPTMQAIFEKRPLRPEEILLLTALFENESQLPHHGGESPQVRFVATAVVGLCGALALVGWIWRKRFRNVRRSLIAAARGVQ